MFSQSPHYSISGIMTEELFPDFIPSVARNNPMVVAHGIYPDAIEENIRCKSCALLCMFQQSKTWYKCELCFGKQSRWGSNGTDHRVNWFACGKYVKEKNDDV